MKRARGAYGSLNPAAPPELSRFEFLLGSWRCRANLKGADGSWQTLEASWEGRYVLDGYAIMDEFRMTKPNGELLVLGVNVRTYDARRRAWNLRWLNALDGSWTDLAPAELGGVELGERSVSYSFGEPLAAHALTRATYQSVAPDHFTWRGLRSGDGESWEEFLVIDAHRLG